MAIELFDSTGYTKTPKDEFWRRCDSKDDYILDVFEYCKQDPDGDVWVPSFEKYSELKLQHIEWEMRVD